MAKLLKRQHTPRPHGRGTAGERSVDMPHHTEPAATTHRCYDALIAEAEAATGILPTIADCERLAQQLHAAIRDLADRVRLQQDRLPADSPAWQAHEDALLAAQGALCGSLGLGLRSAALHVATLGAAVRALDACAQLASEA